MSIPAWASTIPDHVGTPTGRKPDKCSACATPIWRWYQPDQEKLGEWRCYNCLIHHVVYGHGDGDLASLVDCRPSGIYKNERETVGQDDKSANY
jgi:hypothetical protein